MYRPVTFPREIEELVRSVEETAPDRIVEETLTKLRGGASAKDMLRAAALAVNRSSELPTGHHGGPIHPVCGIHPVYQTSQRLTGDWAHLPIVQNVALSNKHIHAPEMAPYLMCEMSPVDAMEIKGLHSKGVLPAEGGLEATKASFLKMMRGRYATAAEGNMLWLLGRLPAGEVLNLIMSAAIPKNGTDDHFFLYPVYAARALDIIGWEWAPVLLRPVVRYQTHDSVAAGFANTEALLEKHGLLDRGLKERTSERESDVIGDLAARIGSSNDLKDAPELMAHALADGLSLEGAGEAMSIGGAVFFLRTNYGNPMDVHIQTGINARRYLLRTNGISLRNKLLSLLTWHCGPEITLSLDKIVWEPKASPETIAGLPHRSQDDLLSAIIESIETQPQPPDLRVRFLPGMRAPDEIRETLALAQQYSELGYEPMALFRKIGEITSIDDFTEMHVNKFHQAVVEEYYDTREPFRWVHLVSVVKAVAITHGKRHEVFDQAKRLLGV